MTMNYEKTTIEIEGKKYRALNTDYGIYVEPWFEGDIKGTVLNVYCDEKKGGVHVLFGPDRYLGYDLWIYLPYAELRKLNMSRPKPWDYMFFTVHQKSRHPANTRCYQITKAWEATWEKCSPTP